METNKQNLEKAKTTDWRAWCAEFQRQLAESTLGQVVAENMDAAKKNDKRSHVPKG